MRRGGGNIGVSSGGSPPSGAAGGQLSGTYPNPSFAAIDNAQSFIPRNALTGTAVPVSGTANFIYLGYFPVAIPVTAIFFGVSTIGAGAQTAEVGLYSTPLGPNGAGQTLTRIAAQAVVSNLTTLGGKTEVVAWTLGVGHMWTAVRTAMVTTQPRISATADQSLVGELLQIAASGALTGLASGAGVLSAIATAIQPSFVLAR
jgi:hypothetical protein